MIDALRDYGHFVELYEPTPMLLGVYDLVRRSAIGFEGDDLIRSFKIGLRRPSIKSVRSAFFPSQVGARGLDRSEQLLRPRHQAGDFEHRRLRAAHLEVGDAGAVGQSAALHAFATAASMSAAAAARSSANAAKWCTPLRPEPRTPRRSTALEA